MARWWTASKRVKSALPFFFFFTLCTRITVFFRVGRNCFACPHFQWWCLSFFVRRARTVVAFCVCSLLAYATVMNGKRRMTYGRTSGVVRGSGATPIGTGSGGLRVTRAVLQREARTLNKNSHRISLGWRCTIHGRELSSSSAPGSEDLDSVVSGGDAADEEHTEAPARVNSAPPGT